MAHLLQRNLGDSHLTGYVMASKKLELVNKEEEESGHGVISWQSLPRSRWEVLVQGISCSCPGRRRLVRTFGSQIEAEGTAAARVSGSVPWGSALWMPRSPLSQPFCPHSPAIPHFPLCLPFAWKPSFAPHQQPLSIPSTSSPLVASLLSYVSFPVCLYANASKSEHMFLFPPLLLC